MPLLPSSFSSSSTTRGSPTRSEARPSTPLLSDLGTGKEDGDDLPSYSRSTPLRHPRQLSGEGVDELGLGVGIELYSGIESPESRAGSRRGGVDIENRGSRGARAVEEVQEVWGPKSQWMLFIGIGLSAYIYSLDGLTTWQYLQYATSAVLEHSLSGTIGTVQAIIIAVGKPLMAKLADVVGRAETFIIVTILYVIGYIVIATANDIRQIAAGEIFYAFGYTGLQMLQLIVIADMTNLRWRGLVTGMISAPFIINNFVSAEIAQRVLPNWRWGYAMFAILIPISLAPVIIALLWAQWKIRKAKRLRRTRPTMKRNWSTAAYNAASEMDFVGLILIAASLALILLPMGLLKRESEQKWHNPGLFVMMIIGIILLPIFLVYEAKYPSKPVVPMRWLGRGPILGACLVGFLDFTSFYLQYTYLYSYVYVTREWSYRELTYFVAIQSLVMTIFGIVGGAVMWATHRFKYMLVLGLIIRLSGCLAMLRARSSGGTVPDLILCQVLQGIGGGFAAIAIQVSAQASVAHVDVATVTALVLLLSEVGNSVGSATATGIWTAWMPVELEKLVPGAAGNSALVKELFGSMERIVEYPMGHPIRMGAIEAYHNVMYILVMAAAAVAFFPPVVCLILTKDIHLGRAQNAHDGRDLAGRGGSASQTPESRLGRREENGDYDGEEEEVIMSESEREEVWERRERRGSSTSFPWGPPPFGSAGNGVIGDGEREGGSRQDGHLYHNHTESEEGWGEIDTDRSEREGLLSVNPGGGTSSST